MAEKTEKNKKVERVLKTTKDATVEAVKVILVGVAEVALDVAEDGIKKLKKKLPAKK